MCKQDDAFINLFLAILEENDYYSNLRHFMVKRGYNMADMATGLYYGYEKCPDGMSIYYYMDSLEDMLGKHTIRGFHDICDMVEYCYDHFLWKE